MSLFYASGKELVRIANVALPETNDWFLANRLTTNFDQTNYFPFKSSRKRPETIGVLKFKMHSIQRLSELDFLVYNM